jgi:CBS domain-containing protein
MDDMRIEEIMSREVVTCSPDEPLLDVVRQLSSRKFSCLMVIEDNTPASVSLCSL